MNVNEMREPGNIAQAKKEWELLLDSRAWRTLVQALQEQADGLQNEILFGPVRSAEDLYAIERMKGKLEGLLGVTATAEAMLSSLQVDLNEAIERKNDESPE